MNLSEIRDQLATLPTLHQKAEGLAGRLEEAEREVALLLAQYEKERRDVENIERESLGNFILRTFDRYEKKAERERREELEAKVRYDRARTECDSLRDEYERTLLRIREAEALSERYREEIAARRRELMGRLTEPTGRRLVELESERAAIMAQMTEVGEAADVTERALSSARGAHDALEGAEEWATWDVWGGGGILIHLAKNAKLSNAERHVHTLRAQLREMEAELQDVEGFVFPDMAVMLSTGVQLIDFIFDNIFTDMLIRSHIRDNLDQIKALISALDAVRASLGERKTGLETKLAENDREQESVVVDRA